MSRLPGGVFVGAVTLLCGLVFAQFERGKHDVKSSSDSGPAAATASDGVQQAEQRQNPRERQQHVAADDRTKS